MEPLKELTDIVTFLPRGGYLINTSKGYIQFGSPPETIKDTMMLPEGVPTIFVLPNEFFNWIKGMSVAELEFPLYYNFFIQKKKTRIICNNNQAKKFKLALKESLFGPDIKKIHNDFALQKYPEHFYKNIIREMDYFKIMEFDDVVEFCIYEDNIYKIDDISIIIDEFTNFEVYENDNLIAHLPGKIDYKPKYNIGERLQNPYTPPLFGMTCLGPSSGFDPYENTSGFLLWVNHHGIMIDPPVNSTEWLLDSNVSPKFIDSVILTHCHADHDAGTFQKILEEKKVTVYTTKTILESFLRKYSVLTDVSPKYLEQLFNFQQIIIGEPKFIHGARFDIFATLHSIPTIGFSVSFQNKSLTYSSDHNNEHSLHEKLYRDDVIDELRYDELNNFNWDSSLIYHESGVPPLHTPMEVLTDLSEEIQKKTVVYHTPQSSLPNNTGLTMAQFGIEKTKYLEVDSPHFEDTYRILSLIRHINFGEYISFEKAQEFISITRKEIFNKNDVIIKSGTPGDKFYIIYTGNVSITSEDGKFKKVYGAYDYFGEIALMNNESRTADVIAETDVIAYSIDKDKFMSFIKGTDYEPVLERLIEVRQHDMWEVITASTFLKFFTSTQREWLESILYPVDIKKKGTLIKQDEKQEKIFIIRKGEVIVSKNKEGMAILQQGDIAGLAKNMYENAPSPYAFKHNGNLSLFEIHRKDLIAFLKKNPGLIMKLDYIFQQYLFVK